MNWEQKAFLRLVRTRSDSDWIFAFNRFAADSDQKREGKKDANKLDPSWIQPPLWFIIYSSRPRLRSGRPLLTSWENQKFMNTLKLGVSTRVSMRDSYSGKGSEENSPESVWNSDNFQSTRWNHFINPNLVSDTLKWNAFTDDRWAMNSDMSGWNKGMNTSIRLGKTICLMRDSRWESSWSSCINFGGS